MTHFKLPRIAKYIGLTVILFLCNCAKIAPMELPERYDGSNGITKTMSVISSCSNQDSLYMKNNNQVAITFEVVNKYEDVDLEVHNIVFGGVSPYVEDPDDIFDANDKNKIVIDIEKYAQLLCYVDVTYTMYQKSNHTYIAYNYTERFKMNDIQGGWYGWAAGHTYNYEISIELAEITFDPRVGSWDNQ